MKGRIHVCITVASVLCLCLTTRIASAQAKIDTNVVYGMYSGLALLMDVHYPVQPNGYGIVFIYGSGFHMNTSLDTVALKDLNYSHNPSQALLEAGYALFMINHRAAPRFRYPANIEDAQRAVRFVRYNAERFGIDAGRIGVFGASSGGYLSNMLGLADGAAVSENLATVNGQSAKVQAVVSLYSVTDLLAYLRDSSGNSAAVLASFMGAPSPMAADGESEALYVEGSPSHYVTPDDPPILLIHGDADETVPYSQSKLLYEKLKSAGLTAELITMPGGGHGASVVAGPNVPDYKAATVEWFDTYLRGID